jgi:hypothetical protein
VQAFGKGHARETLICRKHYDRMVRAKTIAVLYRRLKDQPVCETALNILKSKRFVLGVSSGLDHATERIGTKAWPLYLRLGLQLEPKEHSLRALTGNMVVEETGGKNLTATATTVFEIVVRHHQDFHMGDSRNFDSGHGVKKANDEV